LSVVLFDRVRSWWSLTRLARSGALGPSFNAGSSEAAALAQKLAALHPDERDDDLATRLRPVVRRRGSRSRRYSVCWRIRRGVTRTATNELDGWWNSLRVGRPDYLHRKDPAWAMFRNDP
jgi:hypothetical protein